MPPTRAPSPALLDEAGSQLGEINVKHHYDEQEQHSNGADIDNDQVAWPGTRHQGG